MKDLNYELKQLPHRNRDNYATSSLHLRREPQVRRALRTRRRESASA